MWPNVAPQRPNGSELDGLAAPRDPTEDSLSTTSLSLPPQTKTLLAASRRPSELFGRLKTTMNEAADR